VRLERVVREGENPVCHWSWLRVVSRAQESRSLGMERKVGGRLLLKLNMRTETDSEQVL
jgi:hypothetical protein